MHCKLNWVANYKESNHGCDEISVIYRGLIQSPMKPVENLCLALRPLKWPLMFLSIIYKDTTFSPWNKSVIPHGSVVGENRLHFLMSPNYSYLYSVS